MIQKQWNPESIKDKLQLKAIQEKRPLSCIFELTYRCNFNCRMCYIHMSDEQASKYGRLRTLDEWLDMACQIRDAGVLYLTLTGGECTRYPDFIKLYEQLYKMGFLITIMTNAGSYTDEIRELFRRLPPSRVGITLYGGCNETYQAVTGDKEGFDKTIRNIRFFQSIGVPVGLNFTIIKQNVRDYPLVAKACKELNRPYTLISDITGHRYDHSLSDALSCRLSPAERVCVLSRSPEEVLEALDEATELEKKLADFVLPKVEDETLATEQDYCIGSLTGCTIAWNGEMNTCVSMMCSNSIKPFEIGFSKAWEQLKSIQEEVFRKPNECINCSMASECILTCAGRRFEGTGITSKPDPYTCQYTYLSKVFKNQGFLTEFPASPECF